MNKGTLNIIYLRFFAFQCCRLTLDFQINKKIAEEVALIPSKRIRNKVAGFVTVRTPGDCKLFMKSIFAYFLHFNWEVVLIHLFPLLIYLFICDAAPDEAHSEGACTRHFA